MKTEQCEQVTLLAFMKNNAKRKKKKHKKHKMKTWKILKRYTLHTHSRWAKKNTDWKTKKISHNKWNI